MNFSAVQESVSTMANEKVTFHRLTMNRDIQPQYYVMKLGLYHDIIIETVDGVPVDNIREYIHHYISDDHIGVYELGELQGGEVKLVLVYDMDNEAPINPMATKLAEISAAYKSCSVEEPSEPTKGSNRVSTIGSDREAIKESIIGPAISFYTSSESAPTEIIITDRAFICLAVKNDEEYTLQGIPESIKDDLVKELIQTFEPQRELDFTTGRTVRKLALGSPSMNRVFCNILKQVAQTDVDLHVEHDFINKDKSHVIYYRSAKGLYLIECTHIPKSNHIEVTMFRRVKVLHQAFDQAALKKMEFMEALGILNGRFVNKRVAMGKALEGVVKQYLQDTGYEYKKANPEDPDWKDDYVSILPYKDNYYASIWLVDDTQMHIDIEVKKKIVHMKVYEELLKKEYEAR
ncbi:hypothetical protein [uncultured Veillonella sp.]|uniref:hypothetical protein n=1 Tax=uncultured Veillonella sp. TaxID=159268 RepID=UPI0025E095C3|nr:hypothetical protein [uncultured Veillonella sp.]